MNFALALPAPWGHVGQRIVLSEEELSEARDLAVKIVSQGEKYGYFQPDGLDHDTRVDRFRIGTIGEIAVGRLYGTKPIVYKRDFSREVRRGFHTDIFHKGTPIQVKTTRSYGQTSFCLENPTLTYICYFREGQGDVQIVTMSYEASIQKQGTGYLLEVPKEKWQKIEK